MSDVFNSIKSLVPKRSRHVLHNYHGFDAYIGDFIPFYQRDVVPGDNLKLYLQSLIREKPLLAPVMGQKDVYFRFFFVPYRILDDKFEEGVTGGEDGTVNYSFPSIFDASIGKGSIPFEVVCGKYTLWDYFGFALKSVSTPITDNNLPKIAPIRYLWDAVNSVWNNYIRDEDLQDERSLDSNFGLCMAVPKVNYARDYFTSSALEQQKGIAPSFSMTGILPIQVADFSLPVFNIGEVKQNTGSHSVPSGVDRGIYYNSSSSVAVEDRHVANLFAEGLKEGYNNSMSVDMDKDDIESIASKMSVDISNAVGFDVAELRQLVQIQKILERASRTGSRYTEWLRSFFSVAPSDARLNRPEYIGGYRQTIVSSEVLQTGDGDGTETNSVGAMKGHGISASSTFIGKYFVKEYGCILGFMYCRPKVAYTQGVNRQWIKRGRYDFYLPQLCNLAEQGIYNGELFYTGEDTDQEVWGFQGAWSEMRSGTSVISGSFRDTLNYWNLGRTFASLPNNNGSFIEVKSSDWQRFYEEQTTPQLYCETDVTEDIVRPITKYPEPGRLDHDM